MRRGLPKRYIASIVICGTLAGFTGYSWYGFADALASKNAELAALAAERDELLKIMVAQDGLIQSQTKALQNAKLDNAGSQAEILAHTRQLAQMRAELAAKHPSTAFRPPEKVGRETANNLRRINRLWQK